MFSFYTSIMIICWMTLAVLCILINKNEHIQPDAKKLLYATYIILAIAAMAEWCGVQLDGRTDMPIWMLKVAKCADYIFTPMAGGALVVQIQLRNHWQKAVVVIILINTIFQLIAVPGGWMLLVDENHHYIHGPMFRFYFLVCFTVYAVIIAQFTLYGMSYRKQNRVSLYTIMAIVMLGIIMQELGDNVRTEYLGMTIGAALLFIHYSEFSQMNVDNYIEEQQRILLTDAMTGAMSRYAYSRDLSSLSEHGSVPDDLLVYSVDVNGLKQINDSLGHKGGDEVIIQAARCIQSVFGDARCYRVGGDEFVVVARGHGEDTAKGLLDKLHAESAKWTGSGGQKLTMAVGYAISGDNKGLNAEGLVRKADLAMYAAKSEYYRKTGNDRRKRDYFAESKGIGSAHN